MNKKLISIAVGAALTAGTVVAQAAEESMAPTVYGKIHMSYGAVKDETTTGGTTTTTTDNMQVQSHASRLGVKDETTTGGTTTTTTDNMQVRSHASRLGVKGAVPINDSLKGTYKLEYEVNPDSDNVDAGDGTAGLKRRNQYVGLKGGFGEVRIGRHDTPTKMYQGKFDEFNDTDADIKGVVSISRAENRIDNVVAYISPDWSGFNFAAAIAPGEGNGEQGGGGDGPADAISLAAGYKVAGLFVSLGYDQYDKKSTPIKNLTRLIATYGNKMFQVGGLYEMSSKNEDEGGTDKDVMGVSAHVNFADVHKIKAQYMMGTEERTGGDVEESQISLGYDFKLGKATTAYAMYTMAEDQNKAAAGEPKREFSFIGIGMIQNF